MELNPLHVLPRPLPELETAWLTLFTKLRRVEVEAGTGSSRLAAPFLSTPRPGYKPGGSGTVMLVGKATAGTNTLGNLPVVDVYDVATVKGRTSGALDEAISGDFHSDFWRFARRLSDLGMEQTGLNAEPLSNLIWTNLAKIGVLDGNPAPALFSQQEALAVETILAEVSCYKPGLVVLVTGDYCYGSVDGIVQKLTGSKEEWRDGILSSPRRADAPAVLWIEHPGRKPREWSESRIARAKELLAS